MESEEQFAKDLFNKFYQAITPNSYRAQEAKKCAIICVNELKQKVEDNIYAPPILKMYNSAIDYLENMKF